MPFSLKSISLSRRQLSICYLAKLLLCLILFSNQAVAKEFYRTSLPNVPEGISDFIPLNDTTIIYTDTSFGQVEEVNVFSYDVNTRQSTELATVAIDENNQFMLATEFSIFAHDGKNAYISVSGTLIITDGTPAGTETLGVFGTGFCCFVGAAFSRISNFVLVNDQLYFTFDNELRDTTGVGSFASSRSVWTSDGTPTGTQQLSPTFDLDTLSSSLTLLRNNNGVFYFGNNGIFDVNGNHTDPILPLSPQFIEEFRFINFFNRRTTSAGSFFCDSKRTTVNGLWHFTNTNELKQISSLPCYRIEAINDRLFYRLEDTFFEFDNTNGIGQRLFPSNSRRFSPVLVHQTNDDINFVISDSNFDFDLNRSLNIVEYFQLTQNNEIIDRSTELQATLSGPSNPVFSLRVSGFENQIAIFEPGRNDLERDINGSDRSFLFKPSTGETAKVILSTGTNHPVDAVPVFDTAFTSSRFTFPSFISRTAPPALTPIITSLLEQED